MYLFVTFLLTRGILLLYKYTQDMTKQARDTLKSLFSSAIRADVLALLLNNADERFYVREIATLLRKNPSGVKRELDNLENMGILISKKVANLKYFQAEKKSPFFTELKSIIAKSLGVPGALKAMLKTTGAKIAFIFGPYTASEEADTVNVLIIGTVSLDGIKDIEERFIKKISVTMMDEAEFKSKKEIGDPELEKLLSGEKIILMGKL
jgi:predicted transcriptional regulator with HTH domain